VKSISATALIAMSIAAAYAEPAGSLAAVNAALQAGAADQALSMLNSLPASAEAHNLRCRVLFTLEHWDSAARECEEAVRMDGGNSGYHMWLGRALGEKASRASFMSAFSEAKRVRAEFETAARLDPRNAEALADLGEFYSSAPGVVGGGEDKANRVAVELDSVDPARAQELRGRIAESNKDYDTAEREFKLAVEASHHPAFQWMTLGSFYRKRERPADAEAAVLNGFKAAQRDRTAAVALFNGASVLTRVNRNPALAAKMLEDYLSGPAKTEEAPAFVAHTRLAHLLAQLGEKDGARKQREEALALAHDYKPALDLKL
jgi:tetratricopeptide (TPR) repeat protein